MSGLDGGGQRTFRVLCKPYRGLEEISLERGSSPVWVDLLWADSVCHDDDSYEPLAPGDRWYGPNRGLCLINRVDISLNRSNPPYKYLECTPYKARVRAILFFS